MLLFFSIGVLVLVVFFLLFTGAAVLYLSRSGRAQVTDTLPANLPPEIPICTGFKPAHVVVVDVDGGKRYQVQGDCPENRLQLVDDMVRQMAYLGWQVRNEGGGNLSGFLSEKHERLDVALSDSSSAGNQTLVTMQMRTGVQGVPPEFAAPSPGRKP
jgi:hypothetical protein